MDTRTPRNPTGGGAPAYDERVLTMPRVPSDPAQVIVNHASFRVQLGAASSAHALRFGAPGMPGAAAGTTGPVPAHRAGLDDTARLPVVPPAAARRRAPVVWSGQGAPGDRLAGELMQAVRRAAPGAAPGTVPGAVPGTEPGATTQVLPRVDDTTVMPPVPTVVGQRGAPGGAAGSDTTRTGLLPRPYGPDGAPQGPYGPQDPHGPDGYGEAEDADGYEDADQQGQGERRPRNRRGEPVRHAWYPGRRMNLGIVLLPLRVFLGFVCIYAGMGKLCDRVYFDGGKRGSMVVWLSSLHPWALAEPLRDAALNHPVGAGLSIAFLQVVVGVLTVVGLWQRIAAVFGAGLSIALLVTVSWRTVPVYDAPDFIYLAAWSPLVIAGAPVYSIDGHLASDAWRRLGPRVALWDLRRRVLRRGSVLATLIIGSTLLVGSVLGAAVRANTTQPRQSGPSVVPTNNLPGVPLPEVTGGDSAGVTGRATPRPSASATGGKERHEQPTGQPSATATARHHHSGGVTGTTPGAGHATGGSSSPTGSASGGSGGQPPATSAPTQAPEQPPTSTKPSQGAIGGLLGSHSPTGLLLGMPSGGGAQAAPAPGPDMA